MTTLDIYSNETISIYLFWDLHDIFLDPLVANSCLWIDWNKINWNRISEGDRWVWKREQGCGTCLKFDGVALYVEKGGGRRLEAPTILPLVVSRQRGWGGSDGRVSDAGGGGGSNGLDGRVDGVIWHAWHERELTRADGRETKGVRAWEERRGCRRKRKGLRGANGGSEEAEVPGKGAPPEEEP